MFQVGSAEEILNVPLFAELYGYGPFHGRRNIGVHDLLYCRAFFFRDDNGGRAMIIYSDLCITPDSYAHEMREKISQTTGISPDCIAFVATHTHSGPCLGNGGIGWGEPDQTFQENWKHQGTIISKDGHMKDKNGRDLVDTEEIKMETLHGKTVQKKMVMNQIAMMVWLVT